jgi:uncharacterized cupredoxin-like copper-binding protein
MRRFLSFCIVAAVAAVAFVLPTSGVAGAKAKAKGGKPVSVRLFEFGVKPSPKFVAAGKITFTAKDIGTMKHEMVLVRVQPGTPLPTAADGSVDEAAIPAADKLGEVGNIKPKKSGKLTKTLAPGDYMLFCNLVTTSGGTTYVHYAEGMHSEFTAG